MSKECVTKHVTISYSPDLVGDPIVYLLVKEFDLQPNIIKASVNPDKEGYIVLTLTGEEDNYIKAIQRLKELGLGVKSLVDQVSWDENVCTQCGACTAVCPSGALSLNRPDMTILFDGEKCVVCHMCIQACPVNAVKLDL